MIPKDYYFTKEHEWARLEGTTVIVGITEFAQEQLGEVTFVELPSVGLEVKQTDSLGSVESVKAASDIYSPVVGKVAEVNDVLNDSPERLNDDPYETGWFCKLEVSGSEVLEGLMDAAAYENYLQEC